MTVVWTDNFYRKVVKHSLTNGGYKYYIIFDEDEIEIYDDDMLEMCRDVIQDAESEDE